MTHEYTSLTRFWTLDDDVNTKAEIQLEARPDEDTFTGDEFTSLQVHDLDSGEPLGGQAVFNPDQLAELYNAIGKRLAELNHPVVTTAG